MPQPYALSLAGRYGLCIKSGPRLGLNPQIEGHRLKCRLNICFEVMPASFNHASFENGLTFSCNGSTSMGHNRRKRSRSLFIA